MAAGRTINLLSTPQFEEKLDTLGGLTGRRARAAVLRDALELYDLVVRRVRQGKRVYVGERREDAAEIVMVRVTPA